MGFDEQIFHLINTRCACPALDWAAPLLREKLFWLPFYAFLVAFFLLNFQKSGLRVLLLLGLTVGAADFTSSELLKKSVRRPRPCNDPVFFEKTTLRLPACGAGWSFPSSHAANHFAAAVFLGLLFGKKPRWARPALFGWAAAVGLAQIYVGVHWPTDVLGGAMLGCLMGWAGHRFGRSVGWLPSFF